MDHTNSIKEERLLILLQGFIKENLNVDEKIELQNWASIKPENQRLLENFKNEEFLHQAMQQYGEYDTEVALQNAKSRVNAQQPSIKIKFFSRISWPRYVAAAMVLLTLSIAFVLMQGKKNREAAYLTFDENINPGGNRASLTLANGRTIDLSDHKAGVVIRNGKLTYTDGAEVPIAPNDIIDTKETANLYSTLTTPIGGQYQVILPDGTKVWLNAASSLKYPAKFSDEERRVELTGEAYFEVSRIKSASVKNRQLPFFVKTANQEVEVLGTHFNINAYADERATKTTLLEGSVRVSYSSDANPIRSVLLKPNQQSVIKIGNSSAIVNSVDPSSIIAWKNGLFDFQDRTLEEVMRQLARWYNLEVVYEGAVPQMEFFGKIRRSNKLSEVLHILESSGIHFRVERGRKLIIDQK